jgi:hypothetical protein|tara:strand:+ start:8402 stop:8704 length:303 start_codon:yes stop_codon:yes gene_type:complete
VTRDAKNKNSVFGFNEIDQNVRASPAKMEMLYPCHLQKEIFVFVHAQPIKAIRYYPTVLKMVQQIEKLSFQRGVGAHTAFIDKIGPLYDVLGLRLDALRL